MRCSPPEAWMRLVLLALYGLAVAFLPLAHHGFARAIASDLAGYALPDGTLPLLCQSGGSGSEAPPVERSDCPACTLMTSPGLAAPCAFGVDPPSLVDGGEIKSWPAEQVIQRIAHASARPRGPPLS